MLSAKKQTELLIIRRLESEIADNIYSPIILVIGNF